MREFEKPTTDSAEEVAEPVLPSVRAAGFAGQVLALQRRAGNAATLAALASTPVVRERAAPDAIRRRWLVNRDDKTYFWEDDGAARGAPPAILAEHGLREQAPAGAYNVGRGARGVPLYEELDLYVQSTRGFTSARAARDYYNPFDRFASSSESSVLLPPRMPADRQTKILAELTAKESSYRAATGAPAGVSTSSMGYPLQVVIAGGKVLNFLSETEAYGAVYSSSAATPPRATQDPARVCADLDALGLRVVPSDDKKVAQNFGVDKTAVEAYSGKPRSIDQRAVMGASAGDAAAHAGFDPDEGLGWEWLHLIAHSMSGIEIHGPQVAENLVAGTSECNTQMIVVEEMIKDIVTRHDGLAKLFVVADMLDKDRHIASRINYQVLLYNDPDTPPQAVYVWVFDPLSRRKPLVIENREARYAGREAHAAGVGSSSKHMPMSAATAHGAAPMLDPETGTAMPTLEDQAIDAGRDAFITHGIPGFIEFVRSAGAPDAVPLEVFSEVAELLSNDEIQPMVRALYDLRVDPRSLGKLVWSFLYERKGGGAPEAKSFFIELFGSADAVPEPIVRAIQPWLPRDDAGSGAGGGATA